MRYDVVCVHIVVLAHDTRMADNEKSFDLSNRNGNLASERREINVVRDMRLATSNSIVFVYYFSSSFSSDFVVYSLSMPSLVLLCLHAKSMTPMIGSWTTPFTACLASICVRTRYSNPLWQYGGNASLHIAMRMHRCRVFLLLCRLSIVFCVNCHAAPRTNGLTQICAPLGMSLCAHKIGHLFGDDGDGLRYSCQNRRAHMTHTTWT